MMVSLYRRMTGNKQFFLEIGDGMQIRKFRTSGNAVAGLTFLSMAAYITLLILTLRLES